MGERRRGSTSAPADQVPDRRRLGGPQLVGQWPGSVCRPLRSEGNGGETIIARGSGRQGPSPSELVQGDGDAGRCTPSRPVWAKGSRWGDRLELVHFAGTRGRAPIQKRQASRSCDSCRKPAATAPGVVWLACTRKNVDVAQKKSVSVKVGLVGMDLPAPTPRWKTTR